jgi:hypothetical protein
MEEQDLSETEAQKYDSLVGEKEEVIELSKIKRGTCFLVQPK